MTREEERPQDPEATIPVSERARRMLADGHAQRRASPWTSPSELSSALSARGYPVSNHIVQFELMFGGMLFSLDKYKFELGIQPEKLDEHVAEDSELLNADRPDEQPKRPVDLGLIPCGSGWSSTYELFIDIDGTIHAADDRVRRRSSSAGKLIEQLSMLRFAEANHHYRILIRPQLGGDLAKAMSLSTVDDATDSCESWWSNDGMVGMEARSAGDARSDSTFVFTSTLDDVAALLRQAHLINSQVGFYVSDRNSTRQMAKRGEPTPTDVPDVESFREVPAAHRFRLDNGQHSTGTIWLLKTARGHRIEQFRVYEGRVRAWSSFDSDGSIDRSW